LGTVRSGGRTGSWLGILLLIPLVTPEIVAGVSAFVLFAQLGVHLSLTTIILAHITFSISYVVVVVRGRLASMGKDREEAALDLGATPWQAFWRVTFPITLPGAVAGSAHVFIPVSGEYLIPHFIGDGKVSVAGTTVMEWFDHRHWPYAAAVGAWLAAIVLLPIGGSLWWKSRVVTE
jgi:ABC-type spermidine/putrescine transport system permease subunit II